MKREQKKKHKNSMTVTVIVLVLILAATRVISEAAFSNIGGIEEEECKEVLKDSANAVKKEIVVRFEDNINILEILSNTIVRSNILDSYEAITKQLNFICEETMFKRIDVLYEDNSLLLQTGEFIDASGKMSFEDIVSNQPYVSKRVADALDSETAVVRCYVPIIENDKTVAMIAGIVECTELAKIITTEAYDGQAHVCIIDKSDGAYIINKKREVLGSMYSELSAYRLIDGYKHITLVKDMQNGKSGVVGYETVEGENCSYMYYTPVGISDWQLLIIADKEVAFSGLIEIREILSLIGWVEVLLFIICFTIFFTSAWSLRKSKAETEKQLKITSTLIECIDTLSHGTDMDKAINSMLEIVNGYFQGKRTYLFEINYENETITNTYEYAIEGVTKEIDNLQDVPILSVTFWIEKFNEEGMFFIRDIEKDVDKNSNTYEILRAQNIHSLIAVPVLKKDKIIGFFGVDDPKVNYKDVTLLSSASLFLSDDLEKRSHKEQLERLSYEDALTKLYNRNKFDEVVDELKDNEPECLGVAYVDLNGLKTINDEKGHKAGDAFIRAVSGNIFKVFGKNAFRIGGDEFVVILPGLDRETFEKDVERMRKLMKAGNLSVSVGTSWSDVNVDIIEQMHKSDEKMYEEKKKYYAEK